MFNETAVPFPPQHEALLNDSRHSGFSMSSDLYTGALLRTLAASKPAGNFLELGTGTGLALSFLADGMDAASRLTSIDNSEEYLQFARKYFSNDARVTIICSDADKWINGYTGEPFDLVFADTWAGKFHKRDEIVDLIKPGGFYVIDDLLPQPNWPSGHEEKVKQLMKAVHSDQRLTVCFLNWSTGICIATKK